MATGRVTPVLRGYQSGGTVDVDSPLSGDGSPGSPLDMPAATNLTPGHMTAAQVDALEQAAVDIAALQAALPAMVVVPSDGTYQTTAGGGTNVLPSNWAPATGKQYRVRTTVWAKAGSGDRGMLVLEALLFQDGVTVYLGSPSDISTVCTSSPDLVAMAAVYTLGVGGLRVSVTGVALFALTWGAVFEISELPNA